MLFLKRVTHFNEMERCDISGDYITYGEYYYQSDIPDENNKFRKVKAEIYHAIKEEKRRNTFDYSAINRAQNEAEYKQLLKDYERALTTATILDEPVAGVGTSPYSNQALKDKLKNLPGGNK